MKQFVRWESILTIVLLGVLSGCSRGDLPELAPVTGKVTLDGKPVRSGLISFVPDPSRGTDGTPGIGNIDENGNYRIATLEADGAQVGFHKVRAYVLEGGVPAIPERYLDPDKSGLTFEVKAGQENVFDVELKSQ
jgi:hypothetical protein